jgi:hypothetical protein
LTQAFSKTSSIFTMEGVLIDTGASSGWLVLICCERKVLLAGWLMLVCYERKTLLTGGWKTSRTRP